MSYFTVDFGVNYASKKLRSSAADLIKKAYDLGVDRVLSISNNISEAVENISLSAAISQLHFTIGVHPHEASRFKDSDLDFIRKHVSMKKCYGIGEIGLDFNRKFSSPEKQILSFEKQLKLAKELNVPVYLHCRDAYPEFIRIIREHKYYNGIVHCFTGTVEQALELTSLGFKLGITGWLLDRRRNTDLVKVVTSPDIKLDSLIVETDAPYLAIYPRKVSVPEDTAEIVQEIARLKNVDEIECGKILYANAMDMLRV